MSFLNSLPKYVSDSIEASIQDIGLKIESN